MLRLGMAQINGANRVGLRHRMKWKFSVQPVSVDLGPSSLVHSHMASLLGTDSLLCPLPPLPCFMESVACFMEFYGARGKSSGSQRVRDLARRRSQGDRQSMDLQSSPLSVVWFQTSHCPL